MKSCIAVALFLYMMFLNTTFSNICYNFNKELSIEGVSTTVDIILMLLGLIGTLMLMSMESIKLIKKTYNPYFFRWKDQEDKSLFKGFIIILAILPPIWIENHDLKRTNYILFFFLLLLTFNLLNWTYILTSSTGNIETRKIALHTIAATALLTGTLLFVIFYF